MPFVLTSTVDLRSAIFRADGSLVAPAGRDWTLRIWSAAKSITGAASNLRLPFTGRAAWVTDAAFYAHGKIGAAAGPSTASCFVSPATSIANPLNPAFPARCLTGTDANAPS